MNRESKLHGNAMCTDCENLIKALNAEILCFKAKIETLKKFTDNNSEGDSVEAMNARCLELSAVIEKMIEGDKKDIQDLKLLKEKVRDVYIDGEDVLEKMDTAQRGARECYEKAASLSHAAELAETPWEKDYLNGLASASRSQGESWDRIYDFWKGQAELYDEIDSETSTLFTDGIAYHREASTMMVSFLQCGLTAPNYTGSKSRKISKSASTTVNGVSKEEIYKYDRDYLLGRGFTEEEIEYLYKTKPELFSSLYATTHWSTSDSKAILKNMTEELNNGYYKLTTENEVLEKQILDAFGWNYSNKEIKELDRLLQEFGITNKYSIVCFLMCCNHESSRNPNYLGRKGFYYDNHGILYSEIEPRSEYGELGKGIGYIQVTYVDKHKEAYDYLIQHGYITDDDPAESEKDGYVKALAQNPWAVSAWYWTHEIKVGKSLSLNDYVVSVIESDDYNYFSLGLPFVCEAFVNGKAPGGEIDDIHHFLARGTDKEWTVEDNIKNDTDWLIFDGNNTGYSSIDRFGELENNYNRIKGFIE